MAGTDWYRQAECAGYEQFDWFDLECDLQQTLTICNRCTVKQQCLSTAVKHRMTEGVWGGLYGKQLIAMVNEHRSNDATLDDAA